MSGKLVPDELWNEIEQLFPAYEPSPDGGRPTKDARTVLTTILFVLKTGIAWVDLPPEAFGCSYNTSTRRIAEWSRLGRWQQMHALFLAKLRGAEVFDWSRVLVDCRQVGPIRQRVEVRIALR